MSGVEQLPPREHHEIPPVCEVGELFSNEISPPSLGLYYCSAKNVWTQYTAYKTDTKPCQAICVCPSPPAHHHGEGLVSINEVIFILALIVGAAILGYHVRRSQSPSQREEK